jgi:hypothetical protein
MVEFKTKVPGTYILGFRRARSDFLMWMDRPTQRCFRASKKAAKTAPRRDGVDAPYSGIEVP